MSHSHEQEIEDEFAGVGDTIASATRVTPGHALRPEDIALQDAPPAEDNAEYALWLGDDSLILAQRLSWWISRAPEMEEDVALGNIALDLLGHARSFLTYASKQWGKTEDELAYWREEEEFRNLRLTEQPNGGFGETIARQLYFAVYQELLYTRLVQSTDSTIAAISAKALKEVAYHVDHATQWCLRLGMGTDESARRLQHALNLMWPYVGELFQDEPLNERIAAAGIGPLPSSLREEWDQRVSAVIEESELQVPQAKAAMAHSRAGDHSEHLGYLLAEMQVLARKHPGASW
ncbi:1,2-phenylacetyl-CoA epoxidase subunit PaaC [Galactobacter caseinivorans]|uniref:Phenylacetate-CoA oxygenase subunit PaaI n=1 Tax=Galactobacter caseinivorans TaxID=2676123 RepID=A0A496PLF8_9MICC|nr:1,2-phenylacetyl-CoA epoxidase subunit PaaC [Galactobacter caseinivorans]RKW71382.1 phenylacetate-CoA oxygenase subunit PaaI [Galactobacter caseinivorans]